MPYTLSVPHALAKFFWPGIGEADGAIAEGSSRGPRDSRQEGEGHRDPHEGATGGPRKTKLSHPLKRRKASPPQPLHWRGGDDNDDDEGDDDVEASEEDEFEGEEGMSSPTKVEVKLLRGGFSWREDVPVYPGDRFQVRACNCVTRIDCKHVNYIYKNSLFCKAMLDLWCSKNLYG